MGFGKFLGCVIGGAAAVIAAPVVLPAAAAVGAAAASTAVGGAVVGAATAAGTAVAGAAAAVGGAVASTAVGGAVVGAATVAAEAAGTTLVGAVASSVVGAGLTYSGITSAEGFSNMIEAEEKIEVAKRKYKNMQSKLEEKQQESMDKLYELNNIKLSIYSNELKETIRIIKKIKNVKETEVKTNNIEFIFKEDNIKEIEKTALEADKIFKSSKNAIGMASAMSSLATGLASNFGVASTGTAISSLSGAAAKKATLAALGGGAKAAGGAGIAGGQIMLGGISLIPTAIILSNNYAKKSEEELTRATKYYSDVNIEVEKINNIISWIDNNLNLRIDEIKNVLGKMRSFYVKNTLSKLIQIDAYKSVNGAIDYSTCSKDEKECIVQSAKMVSNFKEIIKAPLLDENGVIKESTISLVKYFETNERYA